MLNSVEVFLYDGGNHSHHPSVGHWAHLVHKISDKPRTPGKPIVNYVWLAPKEIVTFVKYRTYDPCLSRLITGLTNTT